MSGHSERAVAYGEIYGRVTADTPPRVSGDLVILSSITKGELQSPSLAGVMIRFVARGEEVYRVEGRDYRLRENELMINTQPVGAEVAIRHWQTAGTLGLCVYLERARHLTDVLDMTKPITTAANSSVLGKRTKESLSALLRSANRSAAAGIIADRIAAELPSFVNKLSDQLLACDWARPVTGIDAIRKVSVAQAYLEGIDDRAVSLDELAQQTGVSRFHLLRTFRAVVGETPAVFQRKLRLKRAKAAVESGSVTIDMAARRFGFGGGSSFSHTYRRAFGSSLSQELRGRRGRE